jgi:hypothetical protein
METIRYIHEWVNDKNHLVFHTLPMFHIGQERYYLKIQNVVNQMNQVLIEGVPLDNYKQIGRFNKIAHKLGLKSQNEIIKYDDGIIIHNIDMLGEDFKNELSALPVRDKIKLRVLDLFMVLIGEKQKIRIMNLLKEIYAYPKDMEIEQINPENHYAFKHKNKEKYELLIENKRNKEISANLSDFIEKNKMREYRLDIGILFGDEHMPYIYELLKTKGYKWKLEDKVVIF